jgi:sensor histidine kinase YesM
MAVTRKNFLSELRDFVFLGILGVVLTWAGLTCRDCFDNVREFWIIASFSSLIWMFMWKGNQYMSDYIDTKISWFQSPLKRLGVGIVTTIAYTFFVLYTLGFIYSLLFKANLTYGAMYSVIITIVISLFMHGRYFLLNWRQATIDSERLKRENTEARYESLKNQVNPHFLFNSLNALTNLVYEDQDKAVKFIKQLAEVYRYVLDTRGKELVPLHEELTFLKSYLYLQQIRFGDKLRVHVDLQPNGIAILPLALQMLTENAIKHNVVSEDDPLDIHLYREDEFIVMENNVQKKTIPGEVSSGIGLENIRSRYQFLTDKAVVVHADEKKFRVKLPMLKQGES